MHEQAQAEIANAAAEEILRLIYGEDLAGCEVNLDNISDVVLSAAREGVKHNREVLELYAKAIEAIRLLSTPPEDAQISDTAELNALLSDRLDMIHALTGKLANIAGTPEG